MTYTQAALADFISLNDETEIPLVPLQWRKDGKLAVVPRDVAEHIGNPRTREFGGNGPSLSKFNRGAILLFTLYVRQFGNCHYYPSKREIRINRNFYSANEAFKIMLEAIGCDNLKDNMIKYKVVR